MLIVEYENDEMIKDAVSFDNLEEMKAFINNLRVDIKYSVFKINTEYKYIITEEHNFVFCESQKDIHNDAFTSRIIAVLDSKPSSRFLKALIARKLEKLKSNPTSDCKREFGNYTTCGVYCKYGNDFYTESYEYSVERKKVFVKKEVKITF